MIEHIIQAEQARQRGIKERRQYRPLPQKVGDLLLCRAIVVQRIRKSPVQDLGGTPNQRQVRVYNFCRSPAFAPLLGTGNNQCHQKCAEHAEDRAGQRLPVIEPKDESL